jgi:hypothetical protein
MYGAYEPVGDKIARGRIVERHEKGIKGLEASLSNPHLILLRTTAQL